MNKIVLGLLATLLMPLALAQNQPNHCATSSEATLKADTAYQNKRYDQANEHYETAITYTEACLYGESSPTLQHSVEQRLNTLYNSMALTQLKQGHAIIAQLYLALADPKDSKTQFNRKLVQAKLPQFMPKTIVGTYYQYAGLASWNVIKVKPLGYNDYQIEAHLIRPLYQSISANSGELSFTAKPSLGRFIHREKNEPYSNCEIHFAYSTDGIEVVTKQYECGFGQGVSMGGHYQKIAS